MYDWTDLETSRRHRKDLLREAEERRVVRALRRDGKRRIAPSLLCNESWATTLVGPRGSSASSTPATDHWGSYP
jgi:hypothetical protein